MLKWTVKCNSKMIIVTKPRSCHIKLWPQFDGFGFTHQTDEKEAVRIVEKTGLLYPWQHGIHVARENNTPLVERIRTGGEETNILVADNNCQEYHNKHDIVIRSSLTYVPYLSSEENDGFNQDDDDDTEYNADLDDIYFSYDVTGDVTTRHIEPS